MGESPGFLGAGGMICFVLEDNNVRFGINLDAAASAKLKIGSRLLVLAQTVLEKAGRSKSMSFRDLPIRRKLALLILTSSVLAVILACIGFAVYERQNFRANTGNELRALADTLGANTAASLAFNDPKTARAMLGALRADHNVLGACLYDIHGNIFAEYRRAGLGRNSRCHPCAATEPTSSETQSPYTAAS